MHFFFFQAEDGIRDADVTGVQTCALPISPGMRAIPGVVAVEGLGVTDGVGRFVVESARGRDVRGEIFALASQQRWSLLELKRVGTTLEEVFIRIVAGEQAADEARP